MLGTKEQRTEGMKRQAQELIDQAYQRGFKDGQVDNQTFHESMCEKCKNGLIEQGRNEAWEAADKLNRMPIDDIREMFMDDPLHESICRESIFSCCLPELAIEKIREYEQKQQEDELRVGDEVIYCGKNCVVTETHTDKACVFDGKGFTSFVCACDIIKTGRTFPEIAQVLEKMKEGAGE